MKSKKVISSKNLPVRLPIFQTATMYLLLDKFHWQEWIMGALGLLCLLLWVVSIGYLFTPEETDIFNDK